jgi:translation initiation factor IF-2
VSLEDLDAALKETNQLNLIIKGDNSGTVEALEDALLKIDVGDDVELRVIHRGVGGITEGDINLAIADNVIVLGFNVRAEGKATELANREGVEIRYYTVIYQAIEEIEAALKGMLKPEFEEVELGRAEVRQVFRSSRFGSIAGCLVMSGVIRRNAKARLIRDNVVVNESLSIASLRRRRTTSSRSARATSVVSRSAASTTSRKATSSRPSRCGRSPARNRHAMYVGALELDVLLGDVHS